MFDLSFLYIFFLTFFIILTIFNFFKPSQKKTTTTKLKRKIKLLIRHETKPHEKRVILIPSDCEKLIKTNEFEILVEKSTKRIFPISQYVSKGCQIVKKYYYLKNPKKVDFVLGIKELPEKEHFENDQKNKISIPKEYENSHILFAHCFKNQKGYEEVIEKFIKGKGEILDLEFLKYKKTNRRVSGFSKSAGFVGMGLAIMNYYQTEELKNLKDFYGKNEFIEIIKKCVVKEKLPKVIIFGYLGNCGRGAQELLKKIGLKEENIVGYDLEETKKGGPFPEIVTDFDIMINCIYLNTIIPPFITMKLIKDYEDLNKCRLSTIVDVSCDVSSQFNPIPFNRDITTFEKPTRRVSENVNIISIDHLPSLIPKESSIQFSNSLVLALPSIISLKDGKKRKYSDVWYEARNLYNKKKKELIVL